MSEPVQADRRENKPDKQTVDKPKEVMKDAVKIEPVKVEAGGIMQIQNSQPPPEAQASRKRIVEKIHNNNSSAEDVIRLEEEYLQRNLTSTEKKMVTDRVNYLQKHKGHEAAHSQILLIILASLIISQILISIWKRFHLKSYNMATLIGLLFIPYNLAYKVYNVCKSRIYSLHYCLAYIFVPEWVHCL